MWVILEKGCLCVEGRDAVARPPEAAQRGVHPAPNLSDPCCFPSVQSSGRCHRAHGRGCGAAGGSLLASGVTPASSQHACPQGLTAHPQDARGAGLGRWQQEGSALVHPSAKDRCSLGMGAMVHMCVRTPSQPHALWDRGGPGTRCHPAPRG